MPFKKISDFLKKHSATELSHRRLRIWANSIMFGEEEHTMQILHLIIEGDSIVAEMPHGMILLFYHPSSGKTFTVGKKRKSFKYKLTPKFVPAFKQLLNSGESMEEPIYFNKEIEVETKKNKKFF